MENCKCEKKLKPFEKMHGGINFSGAFEGANVLKQPEDYWMFNEKYYKICRERGFDNIRFPVNFTAYCGGFPDYKIDPAFFEKLDICVNLALKNGFYLILDFHHGCYRNNPGKFWSAWEQVAEHYKDYPEELMFELVNEPTAPTEDDWLNEMQAEAVRRIRKTNPTRGIALACNQWNGTWKILSVNWDLFDEYCFLDVHNYYTMDFTHQGAWWGANPNEERPPLVPFNNDMANQVTEHIELCADYMKKTGRTIWIGECGVYFDGGIPEESAKYVEHFTKECARFNVSYAWWEFNVGFGLFSKKTDDWRELVSDNMTITW